jgi:hypothetical protein
MPSEHLPTPVQLPDLHDSAIGSTLSLLRGERLNARCERYSPSFVPVCGGCLGGGVRTGLDHAIASYEEFGVRIDGKPIEKRLQLGPESVAAKRGHRMKLTHDALLCV